LYSALRENTANALNETQCHTNRCVFKSRHVETDRAQQLDHANCQAENSKLLSCGVCKAEQSEIGRRL